MPQLNSASFISQAFWLVVCFCTLWALLSVFITPKLTDIIEQRKRKINDYIQKADALTTQAQTSLKKYEEAISAAQQTADKEIAEGRKNLTAFLDKEQGKMMDNLHQKVADGELLLAKEKQQTLRQIENISLDAALAVVHKLGFTEICRQDLVDVARKDKKHG